MHPILCFQFPISKQVNISVHIQFTQTYLRQLFHHFWCMRVIFLCVCMEFHNLYWLWHGSTICRGWLHVYITKECMYLYPDSKVHGVYMGPTWVLSAPYGPHVSPMNLAIRVSNHGVSVQEYLKVCLSDYICMHWCNDMHGLKKHNIKYR